MKEINNCVCINPGRLVKGVSTGSYAKIVFGEPKVELKPITTTTLSASMTATSSTASELAEMYGSIPVASETQIKPPPPTPTSSTTTTQTQTTQNMNNSNKVNVTFHKI